MDSNHDIVPTLRMMDGVYTRLAADEIERLRARVALLERRADTSLIPGAEPTHRCKVCGAYWRKWNVDGESSWNLCSPSCGECCDNAAMSDQIEALSSPAKASGHVLTFDQAEQALCAAYGRGWRATAATFTSPAKVGGDEREKFNKWASGFAWFGKNAKSDAWDAWQARAALSADGGEDKRDAERYRQIRRGEPYTVTVGKAKKQVHYIVSARPEHDYGEALDRTTDAAIAANQAKEDA